MIAEFPDSTPISLEILPEFATFARRHLPYTEFNFVNLMSWNRNNQGAVSMLDGNLVLRFPSYVDDSQFVTCLGNHDLPKTIRTLLDFAEKNQQHPVLRLVPGAVVEQLGPHSFMTAEDIENHDYVISFVKLLAMEGRELRRFRRAVHTFTRLYGARADFTILDTHSAKVQQEIFDVFIRREINKHNNNWRYELEALKQLFQYAPNYHLQTFGIRIADCLHAFMVTEYTGKGWCIGQFWKADTTFTGIYSYLMFMISKELSNNGVVMMNIQQDLGIESLRFFKLSFGPVMQLKKFVVSVPTAAAHEIPGAPQLVQN